MTEDDIRRVVADYEQDKATATARRDQRLRNLHAAGLAQADIIRGTGYSRETVRQILNPEARAQINARRRKGTA